MTTTYPATEKQLAFLRKLADERKGNIQANTVISLLEQGNVPDKRHTSNLIDLLLQIKPTATSAQAVLEAGMYRKDDVIYKVQKAVHGSGNLYAKRLVLDLDSEGFTFEYAPGVVRNLTADDRMTLEEAKSFGALYGTCVVCGRTLTNETSIAEGIGPICANRI